MGILKDYVESSSIERLKIAVQVGLVQQRNVHPAYVNPCVLHGIIYNGRWCASSKHSKCPLRGIGHDCINSANFLIALR